MSLSRRFWSYARPYLPAYLAGLVLLLSTNGLALWIPWLLRGAIEAIERGKELRTVAGISALRVDATGAVTPLAGR